ncbi:twin-arginine translocation signal domain-containing protein [Salmonella enterica subsp. enterica serovar Infantis]|nr:twin-arginine translocation signal domain-containing protein [Salmonella enterica subsp. enterica serovar Infantis]
MKLSRRSFMKANAVAAVVSGGCRSERAGRRPRRCRAAGSHQMG